MTDPKNPANLPEFDLEIYEVAVRLGQSEEIAVDTAIRVNEQMNSDFIPLDEIDWDENNDDWVRDLGE